MRYKKNSIIYIILFQTALAAILYGTVYSDLSKVCDLLFKFNSSLLALYTIYTVYNKDQFLRKSLSQKQFEYVENLRHEASELLVCFTHLYLVKTNIQAMLDNELYRNISDLIDKDSFYGKLLKDFKFYGAEVYKKANLDRGSYLVPNWIAGNKFSEWELTLRPINKFSFFNLIQLDQTAFDEICVGIREDLISYLDDCLKEV